MQTTSDFETVPHTNGPKAGSYVSGVSDTPLLGMTIGDAFDQTVARFPDHEALISRQQGLRYTWRELRAEV
ncbi:MAG TPA: hypothetical protein VFX31_10060, partial [Ktedonobacterales bacterium]|nr:hypothetical protein [Ktedonobacterales bacterium]